MSDPSADFDPESREEREVAAEAAGDRSELLSLMAHTYRGGARTGSLVAHAHRPNHELGGGADGVAAHVDVLERIAPALRAAHRARNAHRLPQHRGPAVPNIRRVAVPCSDLGGERVRERARPRGRRAVELAGAPEHRPPQADDQDAGRRGGLSSAPTGVHPALHRPHRGVDCPPHGVHTAGERRRCHRVRRRDSGTDHSGWRRLFLLSSCSGSPSERVRGRRRENCSRPTAPRSGSEQEWK